MSYDDTNSAPDESGRPPCIPDLDLLRQIGRGGFGEVWLAANQTTGCLRAVKLIPLKRTGTADPAGREITSLTRLEANLPRQHPNLMHIDHVGQTADYLFYVMDPADDACGGPASSAESYRPATLQHRLDAGTLSSRECLAYAGQLLTALASLHAAGMVHRDVKPANCLFVGGELKLADFGLVTEAKPHLSRVGTQKYMPPDGRMDTRADVYAAGLVIYEMMTGLPADRFPSLDSQASRLTEDPSLSRLIRLIVRACQPDRERRFHDAAAMLAELEGRGLRPTVAEGRTRLRVLGSAVAVAAALGLAAAGWRAIHPKQTVEPPTVHVNFITEKPFFDAEVFLDGVKQIKDDGSPYSTPCTIKDLPGRIHRVAFRWGDLPELDLGYVDFAETRQVEGRW